jgi:crossover junction endodeoxyribonuclease RuvC
MRVLGIDPSLTSTGLALIEDGKVTEIDRVRSKKKGHDRVQDILTQIWSFTRPDLEGRTVTVGIEGPAMHAKGSSVVQIFGLWGVITHYLWTLHVPYYVVTPSGRCKYATGKGNADKDQVLAAVIRRYPDAEVASNDIADALVIAAMGSRYYGHPLEADLPETHLKAMEGVQW